MPRVNDSIQFSIKAAGAENDTRYYADSGITVEEAIRDEFGANPAKFRVFLNGSPVDDLSRELAQGDAIRLEPLNYNSAAA